MNRITSIEPQDEDPNLRIVFVNGEYVATLTSNGISILNLNIGVITNLKRSKSKQRKQA